MDALRGSQWSILLSAAISLALWFTASSAHAQVGGSGSATYAEQVRFNGPTGWVQTSEGRFRVLRFGTATEPHVLRIDGKSPAKIRSVRFRWNCACPKNLTAEFLDGTTSEFNGTWFEHRAGERSWSTYGIQENALPMVVVDRRTREPVQKFFPNMHGISEITFDPPERWQSLAADPIRIASTTHSSPASSKAPTGLGQRDPATGDRLFPVGTRICHIEHDAVVQEPTGVVAIGRPVMREAKGPVSFVGFVEGRNADRIQIRIGGMKFAAINGGANSGSVERFDYRGVQLEVGSIFWDDQNNWGTCN